MLDGSPAFLSGTRTMLHDLVYACFCLAEVIHTYCGKRSMKRRLSWKNVKAIEGSKRDTSVLNSKSSTAMINTSKRSRSAMIKNEVCYSYGHHFFSENQPPLLAVFFLPGVQR